MKNRFASLVSGDVMKIEPYRPGKPIEELKRERGLSRIVKLASNESPLGPSQIVQEAISGFCGKLNRYPDGYGFELKSALAKLWDVPIDRIVLGNGSSEIIEMMVRLFVRPGSKVVIASPSFSIYEITTLAQGGYVANVPLVDHKADLSAVALEVDPHTAMVILGNPNNPTGTVFTRQEWELFLSRVPSNVPILLDEAYAEFVDPELSFAGRDYVTDDRPVVALRTFSKAYGLAALRLGYGIAPAEIVDYMNRLRLPFNANGAAQVGAVAALGDKDQLRRVVDVTRQGRARLERFFAENGVEYIPSQANYVTARVGGGDRFFEAMLDEGVIIRSMKGFGMPEWVRVTIGMPGEMDLFEAAFLKVAAKLGVK